MKKVSDNYYVSAQISEEDLDGLKNEGFSLVVCNRPNGEEENQTDFELIQKRCESIGLTFINLPMIPGDLQSELILETKKILDSNLTLSSIGPIDNLETAELVKRRLS